MKIINSLIAIGTAAAAGALARTIGGLRFEDVLGTIGLERRRSHALGGIGLFGVGAAIGAGAALLLTPKNGKEMREVVRQEVERLGEAAKDALRQESEPTRLSTGATGGTGNARRPAETSSHS